MAAGMAAGSWPPQRTAVGTALRGPELQTPDVDPRGARSPSRLRAHAVLAVALLGLGTALASSARAQESADADCGKDFSAQVAEAIWLRDEEPQNGEAGPPLGDSGSADQLDDRTRFSLAVVIGDLLLLREETGTATWPRTLSRLSSQELRRRRDDPALDATACEIVRFMREYYSAERVRDGAPPPERPDPPRARPPTPSSPPLPRETAPPEAQQPPSPRTPSTQTALATPGTKRGPAPGSTVPRVPPAEAPASEPAPSGRVPERVPAPADVERPRSREPRRVEPIPTLTDEETPPPPPAVAPPEARPIPVPEPREVEDPAPTPAPEAEAPEVSVAPVPEPEPPAPDDPGSEQRRAAAKTDLAALEAQLSAPRYLTLRAIRRNGSSRPDDEVWRMRRQTLEARDEVVKLLRTLAGDPERLAGVKALLGAQGCTRTEKRIRTALPDQSTPAISIRRVCARPRSSTARTVKRPGRARQSSVSPLATRPTQASFTNQSMRRPSASDTACSGIWSPPALRSWYTTRACGDSMRSGVPPPRARRTLPSARHSAAKGGGVRLAMPALRNSVSRSDGQNS
jgi:hypothetical protein